MNLENLINEISKPHDHFDEILDQLPKNIDYEGIYAISIDTSDISGCLLDCLRKNKNNESIIYLGKGNVLSSRLGHELKAEGAGIFFRKFGSYLNYICSQERCSHEKNYKFSYEDENSIKREIMLKLKIKIFETSQHHEKELIKHFNPPFNEQHNEGKISGEVKRKHLKNLHLNKEYYRKKNDRKII